MVPFEVVVIRGDKRGLVEQALQRSSYTVDAKAYPPWATGEDALYGFVQFAFAILYPDDRERILNLPDAMYFTRLADRESWFNGNP